MEQPTWLDKQAYPFTSFYYEVNGVQQHYIDEGKGETLLFVHGTPSWSFDFRNVIKALSGTYRCVALDHIGFGLSDKPRQYDYSTQQHARTLRQFIEHKQLIDITLVLHDFGGPIGLEYALENPGNVKRLVVLNSWIGSSAHDPEFTRFSKILKSPLLPFLYLYLNFSPRFLLPKSFGKNKLPAPILKQFTRPFGSKPERYGTLAFAHSLLNDQPWFEELWDRREVLRDKPMLLIWGMQDKFVTARHLRKFEEGFPASVSVQLEQCGHFPQEEEPERVIEAIREFLSEN
jgi:pimeloyl-ACP methyl ester carboxylesterase